ncbi:hypothetical protein [Niveibacterium sp.]|uniref:hypothetical protein n=1 Tax=Niveibacterium sp. TaxID=2017444 RepID=UPI0035AE2EE6
MRVSIRAPLGAEKVVARSDRSALEPIIVAATRSRQPKVRTKVGPIAPISSSPPERRMAVAHEQVGGKVIDLSGESASPSVSDGEFSVREVPPWTMEDYAIEIDPRFAWYQSTELDVRPAAMDQLELAPDVQPRLDRPAAFSAAVLIDDQGRVQSVQVFERADQLALLVKNALLQVRFHPGELKGQPVHSILLLKFEFSAHWGRLLPSEIPGG